MQWTLRLLSTNLTRTTFLMYINKVKQISDMDPCTIALETDKQFMDIHDCWMNDETIEEFLREEEMNVMCDEMNQTQFTV